MPAPEITIIQFLPT